MLVPALKLIFSLAPASASPVDRRQVVDVPASSSSGPSDSSAGQPVPIAAVVAISAVLGTGVLILLIVSPDPAVPESADSPVHRFRSDNGAEEGKASIPDRSRTPPASHLPPKSSPGRQPLQAAGRPPVPRKPDGVEGAGIAE